MTFGIPLLTLFVSLRLLDHPPLGYKLIQKKNINCVHMGRLRTDRNMSHATHIIHIHASLQIHLEFHVIGDQTNITLACP